MGGYFNGQHHFDVDGTLWDSTEIVAEAWNDYLTNTEHMDTDVSSRRLMGLFGQLLPDIAKALFPKLPESEQLRIIDGCCQAEHEALLRKCAPLYPQLEETLKNLSARFPLFIVSNCQQDISKYFCRQPDSATTSKVISALVIQAWPRPKTS